MKRGFFGKKIIFLLMNVGKNVYEKELSFLFFFLFGKNNKSEYVMFFI